MPCMLAMRKPPLSGSAAEMREATGASAAGVSTAVAVGATTRTAAMTVVSMAIVFNSIESHGQDTQASSRAHQHGLSGQRLSGRYGAARRVRPDHAARQHDGFRR